MVVVVIAAWLSIGAAELGPPAPSAGLAPTVGAVTAPPAGDAGDALRLDLRDALRLGLERSRAMRIARQDAISSRASETQAYGALQPQIGLNSRYSRFDSAVSGFQTGAGSGANQNSQVSIHVEQLLFDGMQSIYRVYSARQDAKAAAFRELAAQLDVAGQVVTAFFEVLRNDALLRLNEQLVAQAERSLAETRAREADGLSSQLDVRRSEVSVSNARVELTAAENDFRSSLSRLRNLLLIPPDQPIQVLDTVPVPAVDLGLDEAFAAALAEQPDIAAADAGRRSRRHALAAERWSRFFVLQISADYDRYLHSSRDVQQEYTLSASINIPLWDGQSAESGETAALAAARRAEEQFHQALEAAALAVEQAYLDWQDASARMAGADEASQLAFATLAETEESYALDVASLLDVSAARTEYARAETNRIQARFDRDISSINLRLAVGRLPLPPATEEDGDA